MRTTGIALALALVTATSAVVPATAQAHGWDHRGWNHESRGGYEHHASGAAIGLGIIGGILAGAAVASSHPYAYYSPYPYGYAGYGYYR